jgi:hypothetical protein
MPAPTTITSAPGPAAPRGRSVGSPEDHSDLESQRAAISAPWGWAGDEAGGAITPISNCTADRQVCSDTASGEPWNRWTRALVPSRECTFHTVPAGSPSSSSGPPTPVTATPRLVVTLLAIARTVSSLTTGDSPTPSSCSFTGRQ